MAANPRSAGALSYIAVERSEKQRQLHPEGIESVGELAASRIGEGFTGMVVANELLDNLSFAPVRWVDGTPHYGHVDVASGVGSPCSAGDDELVEVFLPRPERDSSYLLRGRSRYDQREAGDLIDWLRSDVFASGKILVFDYAKQRSEDVRVRTYSDHGRAGEPLIGLGTKDITIDVDLEALQQRFGPPTTTMPQAEWLANHGVSELVDEGKAIWEREAATGGLDALRAISRVREAEALCDPQGLGGFTALEWLV